MRWFWHGPEPSQQASRPRLMQEIAYDALGEHIARRSVPVSEDTPESALLYDVYEYDAVGREVRHTAPWGALTRTSYLGLRTQVIDPLDNLTVVDHDQLGRPVDVTDAAKGPLHDTYGPFSALRTVTAPGDAVTTMTRDGWQRIRKLEDPDRGTTLLVHDGFDDLVSSTDALERAVTWEYDAVGRPHTRVDHDGAELLTTTWTWDTAAHGIGKLAALASPDGQKAYTYNEVSKLETVTLTLAGESEVFHGRLDYDQAGRVGTITYPTPTGAAPFAVVQDYDPHGYVEAVRDSASQTAYWQLTDVDSAGRYRAEAFGNGVATERSYFADRHALASIFTHHGATKVQDLAYTYDVRGNLESRTDALQPQNRTERFRYDALERLTCTYFSASENASEPCVQSYEHDPNGNLTFKSDVGTLGYDDPLHPHAVTSAGQR